MNCKRRGQMRHRLRAYLPVLEIPGLDGKVRGGLRPAPANGRRAQAGARGGLRLRGGACRWGTPVLTSAATCRQREGKPRTGISLRRRHPPPATSAPSSRLSGAAPTLRRIWRGAYGRDYPEEADPFGFVTVTDLRRIGRAGGRAWTGHSRPGLRPWWPGPVGRPEDRCLAGGGRLLRGGD